MRARLTKEIRTLAWPACLAAFCAVVVLARPFFISNDSDYLHNFASFLFGLAEFGFCAGIVFLAAMSFGVEFQQRTFVLLLSQPTERFRIWRDKMLVLAAIIPAVAVVGLIYYLVDTERDPATVALFVLFVVIIVVCSTSFWTLTARSTIGGVVFSLTVMFMGGGILQAVLEKVVGTPVNQTAEAIARRNFLMGAPMILAGVLYAGTCLYLGWRKFAEMELRDMQAGEAISIPKGFPGASWLENLLRCRPTGALQNLIRKELRLQKPIFLLAGLFTLCWLGILGWSWLFPEHISRPAGFTALSVIYLLFVTMLTGCASFDEERTLGLAAWHLTLPPSAWRQWLVKLGVAASVAVLLGLCLPVLLAVALSEETRTGVLTQLEHAREWSGVFGFLFVLNFWAASLTGNIVRGVLTTILTCFALGGSASLAVWITEQLGGLETPLFRLLIVRFQVPLDIFNESNWMWRIVTVGLVSFVIVVFLVALGQSRRCFRRAQTYEAIPVRQPLVLVLSGFLISFWAADLSVSANNSYQSLRVELSSLAQSLRLRASDFPSPGQKPRRITLEQFEDASRPIPAHIKQWLRNATVALYQKPKADHPSIQNVPAFWVDVSFASTPSDNLHVESIPWDVRQQ